MNAELAKVFVAILNRYEAREISAEEALIEIQIAVADDNNLCEICLKDYPANCTCPSDVDCPNCLAGSVCIFH